jgi:hypothetical protein
MAFARRKTERRADDYGKELRDGKVPDCSKTPGWKPSNAFDAKVYDTDPTKPVGNIKEAWESAKKRTQRHCPSCKAGSLLDREKLATGYICDACRFETSELPVGLTAIRFHDLRHTAVSRMIAARVPFPIVAKIVGWSAGTMAKMAARYGHFGIEELRGAVESIGRGENSVGVPGIGINFASFPR